MKLKTNLENEICDRLIDFFNEMSDVITDAQASDFEEKVEDCLDKHTAIVVSTLFVGSLRNSAGGLHGQDE